MKLSVYLMRDSVTDFSDVLQPKYLDGFAKFEELPNTSKLPFTCKAYVQKNKSKKPSWVTYLSNHFDTKALAKLRNQSNSFVLLVEVSKRIFVITFGYGFQAIDPAKIEPRFGLIVAANALKRNHICTLESNQIDTLTRHKQIHISKGSNVTEFDLNPHMDWIRKLSGAPQSSDLATSLTGGDAVSIGVKCELKDVGAKCEKLLKLFQSKDYKNGFDVIDHLQPIGKHDPILPKLDDKLNKLVKQRSNDRIAIACPEVPNDELLEHYKIISNRKAVELQELGLEGVYLFLDDFDLDVSPADIRVLGVGANDSAVTRLRSLRDYLVCEIDVGKDTYIFSHGEWFRAEKDYVANIRKQVAALIDRTGKLALPRMKNGESETTYNARVARINQKLHHMDKNNFWIGGSYDKIEVCDLLTEDAEMVCIKKMDESSSLSHLFGQGSVSATLLRGEDSYRANFNKVASKRWPQFVEVNKDNIGRVTVVYGVVTRKPEPLSEGMFFFSLINLLNHVHTIRMLGCEVALCRIDYESSPGPPTPVKRRRKNKKTKQVGVIDSAGVVATAAV